MIEYRPGSFFLISTFGWVGWIIAVLQALAGRPSRYGHAGMILDKHGAIIEAEPGGARIRNIREYKGRALLICDGPIRQFVARQMSPLTNMSDPRVVALETAVRDHVVAEARKLRGVPYSYLDYLALAALHLHLPSKWIRRRVQDSGHLICSALVDRALQNAGVHLFSDGRLAGDVMPADLAWWAEDYAQQAAA